MPLITCEVPLILTWSERCVINSLEKRIITNTRRDIFPTNTTFKIIETKLYVPVVTLSTGNDKTLLEHLKTRFNQTRTIF